MTISRKCIEKIADLAALELTEENIGDWTKDLDNILQWANQLQEVDTENVKPMHSVISTLHSLVPEFVDHEVQNQVAADSDDVVRSKWYSIPLRKDMPNESICVREDVLKNAPLQKYGYFIVPKTVK